MPKNTVSPLENLKISYPCPTTWESMIGNDKVRYCGKCQLNVYNLSEMTKSEAEELISSSQGRMCAAFYRRADGKVLTQNCPVGLAAVKQRVANTISLALSLFVTFFTAVGVYSFFGKTEPAINNQPSKSKSLPILNQKTSSEIDTATNKTNQETTSVDLNSSCKPSSQKSTSKRLAVGEILSTNYIEPKTDLFSDKANKLFVGKVAEQDTLTCKPEENIEKD